MGHYENNKLYRV